MTYQQAIEKLLDLKEAYNKLNWDSTQTDASRQELREKVAIIYGEIEDVYIKVAGIKKVEVGERSAQKAIYSTYLEAAILSPWTTWLSEGSQELLKVIGKVSAR